ncbi:uncharacterized protein AB9X84_017448 [Acanthopagrus schlegelii]
MSSVESFREFVNERLTAAAEEIFRVFKTTIVQYEEEIDRQRVMLDVCWKPQVKLHRIDLITLLCVPPELPQQHVCKEEEVLADQQLCNQERNSSLDQEDPEPPEIKEEQEELCTSREGEQLVLKVETETVMLTPAYEESDHSEAEPTSDHQLLSNNSHGAESRDQKGRKHGDSGSTADGGPKEKKRHHGSRSHSDYAKNSSDIQHNTHPGENSFDWDTCGKTFKSRLNSLKKTYSCQTCEKTFSSCSDLKVHMRIHTGEKPFTCNTCGKTFKQNCGLTYHMKTHTGEKPFPCKTCGKTFRQTSNLKVHMRIHTGEKPFTCNKCGKTFQQTCGLTYHLRTHTGEKPFTCKTCGKAFSRHANLAVHMRTHTNEKPYSCQTCRKTFRHHSALTVHMRTHTGEKP